MYARGVEVFLKLHSRPLRLVYLVDNREDLLDAITLFTHTWGGIGNTILPLPKTEDEAIEFRSALLRADPDAILMPARGIPDTDAHRPLDQSPALKIWMSREGIVEHLAGGVPIYIGYGTLPHIASILTKKFPTKLSSSNIYMPILGDLYKLEVAIQAGLPNEWLSSFIENQLSARLIPNPKSYIDLFKTAFILRGWSTPLSLTKVETIGGILFKYGGGRPEDSDDGFDKWGIDDDSILWIYTDKQAAFDAAIAYWNSGIRKNKIYLPWEGLRENILELVPLIVKVIPRIRGLKVITTVGEEQALLLQQELESAFKNANNPIPVYVKYDRFKFYIVRCRFHYGTPDFVSRVVGDDNAVRFKPPIPFGHDEENYLYGFDGEITFSSGNKLLVPRTNVMSVLLSNKLKDIENAHNSGDEKRINSLFPQVRANIGGIAGTVQIGKEVTTYLHSDKDVIGYLIKRAGFDISKNDPARFAEGLITRLGGFEQTIDFINSQGFEIIKILTGFYNKPNVQRGTKKKSAEDSNTVDNAERTSESISEENNGFEYLHDEQTSLKGGFYFDELWKKLEKNSSIDSNQARKVIRMWLPILLSSQIALRGSPLICKNCGLRDWYPLEEVREFIICSGCAQSFQLGLDQLSFTYRSSEINNRFLKSGGIAVLITANLFNDIDQSGYIEFGGNLHPAGKKQIEAEVDLFWLTQNTFIIAECKAFLYGIINIEKIKSSLLQTLNVAEKIGARAVVLGIVTPESDKNIPSIHSLVQDILNMGVSKGIGVHLALNGKLFLYGRDKVADLRFLNSINLELIYRSEETNCGVGNIVPDNIGWASSLIDKKILLAWEYELGYRHLLGNPEVR